MKTILAMCLLLVSAVDSRATLMAITSLEWIVDHTPAIGIYKVVSPGKRPGQDKAAIYDLKLELKQSLKGNTPKTAQTGEQPYSEWPITPEVVGGDLFLVFFKSTDEGLHPMQFMSLANVNKYEAIDARLYGLTSGEAVLGAVRARIAHGPPGKRVKIHDLWGSILSENYLVLPGNVTEIMNPKGAIGLQIPDDLMDQAMTRCDLLQIARGLQNYYESKHVMPSGGNATIIAALIKEGMVEAEEFKGRRRAGKLCDIWGTPYRIDTSNPKFPWAYSCGPNKTDEGGAPGSDDIVSW